MEITSEQIEQAKKMQEEQKRSIGYTDNELSLIKSTFLDNDIILKAIRKVFLQLPITEDDERELNAFKGNKELNNIMRKTFLPELNGDAPINQNIDLWMTIQINDKNSLDAFPHILARARLIAYINQSLLSLQGIMGENQLIFKDLLPGDEIITAENTEIYANLTARNIIVGHTEQMLQRLKNLSNFKDETIEETVKKLTLDSSK